MQLVRVFPCLLFVVACGGGGRPQQQPIPDSPAADGPLADGPESDGPESDGPMGDGPGDDGPKKTVARIWALGDILEDNVDIAGGFAADATLPFGAATPPTIVVPGGAGEVSRQTDNTFDARGSKIAYVADQTVPGRLDLNVADADGGNPIVVIQGGVANVEISALALSPDGTKVAFLMDSTVNGGNDLFFAPTTANATPVQLSPVRVAQDANQDVFSQFEWSADSKFVSFSFEATEDGVDEVFVTDTSEATPTPVTILARADITAPTGTRGIRGRALFDNANNLYFRARVSDANGAQFTFFKSDTAGNKTVIDTPARGDASPSDIGAFAVSPDSTMLVFAADAPTVGIFDMYTAAIATPTTQTKITNLAAAGSAQASAQIAFSPDGTKIALVANFLSVGDKPFEPVVIALDGSSTKRLAALPDQNSRDSEKVVWADNNTVFVTGDIATANEIELFKLDASMEDQTPTLAVDMPGGGDLFNVFAVQPQ